MNRRIALRLFALVALAFVSSEALAQGGGGGGRGGRGGGGQQLSETDLKAAWELQAKGVAEDLGLAADVAQQVGVLYVGARGEHNSAYRALIEEIRGGGGGGGGGFAAIREQMAELVKKHKESLTGKLGDHLSGDDLTKATASLGAFSQNWDRMVHALRGFDLDDDKTHAALTPIAAYIGATSAGADRDAQMEARDTLSSALAEALSEEQANQVLRFARMGGRGGGRPGGR